MKQEVIEEFTNEQNKQTEADEIIETNTRDVTNTK